MAQEPADRWTRLTGPGKAALLSILAFAILLPLMAVDAVAQQPLRLVFADELAPISFVEDGRLKGLAVEIAEEVFRHRLGLEVSLGAYPWERAQRMVERGDADGFISVATPAREAYAQCGTTPVLRAPVHPIARRDHPRIAELRAAKSLEELRQFEIVSYMGNGWARQELAGYKVFYAPDYAAHIRGLAQGRGDIGFVTTAAGPYYLGKLGLGDQLEILPLEVDTFVYVLCIGRKSPALGDLAEFERVLPVLRADGGYGAIFARYGLQAADFY